MFTLIERFIDFIRGRRGGLYEEDDERSFGAHVAFGRASRDDLTDNDFQFRGFAHINQLSTDFCVGCGKAYFKQITEHQLMSWAGAYAMGCQALGYTPKFGISILQVMKGAVKYGVPEEKYWKYKSYNGLPKTGRNYFANWKNMSKEVIENAAKHKDHCFFVFNKQDKWDKFDLFRAYLNKFNKLDQNIVIQTGTDAHNVTLIGQKTVDGELKLVSIDSYGKRSMNYRIGDSIDGYRYFNRAEANQLFTGYIAFDMPRVLAEILVKYNEKVVKTEDSVDCYLVSGGKKHSLVNEKTAWSHNFLLAPYDKGKLTEIISPDDLADIPKGDDLKFEDGVNYPIVKRIMEKYKIK